MHGQNPVKLPVVSVWEGKGDLESRVHKHLDVHRCKWDGGREFFDLRFCGSLEQVVAFVDRYVKAEEAKKAPMCS